MGSQHFLQEEEMPTSLPSDFRMRGGARPSCHRIRILARGNLSGWICGEAAAKIPGSVHCGSEKWKGPFKTRRKRTGDGVRRRGFQEVGRAPQEVSGLENSPGWWRAKICFIRRPAFAKEHPEKACSSGDLPGAEEGERSYGGKLGKRMLDFKEAQNIDTEKDSGFGAICSSGTEAVRGEEPGTCEGAGNHQPRDSSQPFEVKKKKEEEGKEEEKEKEVFELRWFVVKFWWNQHLFQCVEASAATSSGEKAWLGSQNVDGPCSSEFIGREPHRPQRHGSGSSGQFSSKGDIVLPDLGSSPPHEPSSRREGAVCSCCLFGCVEVRGHRESGRPASRQVFSSRNCRLRGVMGDGAMAGGRPLGGAGGGPSRGVASCKAAPENPGPCLGPWILWKRVRWLLGGWSGTWWTMGRLDSLWKRERTKRKARKRQREERKSWQERKREQLVGEPPQGGRKRRRRKEGRSPEVSNDQTTTGGNVVDGDACSSLALHSTSGLEEVVQQPGEQALWSESPAMSGAMAGAPLEGVLALASVAAGGHSVSDPLEPPLEMWRSSIGTAPSLQQLGPRLVWGISRGMVFEGLNQLSDFAKPFAAHVAFKKSPGVFPLPCDFSAAASWVWPPGDFEPSKCFDAWVLLIAAALNSLHGCQPPFPKRRGGIPVKQCLISLRDRVQRFFQQQVSCPLSANDVWLEVSSKQVNYSGEEVAVAQTISLEQILPSLPPLGHGGSVELSPLLEGRTRYLIDHPHEVVLGEQKVKMAKNVAKVHVDVGEEPQIFMTLFERGVVDFVPENEVYSDSDGRFLSGLFGVPKPGKVTASGKPILRLIMNLIPINQTLEVILGDIGELPAATMWQQLVLTEEDMITVSQADMASAFYLFRLPREWLPYLCFNFRLSRRQVGLPGTGWVYPACRVLPMGWASSVGIMQMASRELIKRAGTLLGDELRKQGSIPPWFVSWSRSIPHGNTWWQVYLDNFMSAEVARGMKSDERDRQLHQHAIASWDKHVVLCAVDKHVYSSTVATELGVQINSPQGLIGASADRIYRNVMGSLALVQRHRASLKMVQIILGRWIFILQYRRPAMSVLSRSWDFIRPKVDRWKAWKTVQRELSLLIALTPLLQFDLRSTFSPLVTVSDAFNGMGGCFRAYDLAGIRPLAMVGIEIDPAANRVVRQTWPQALLVLDINLVTLEMVRHWANLFPRATEVHIWGGFPCVHLSSVRSDRLNLEGEGSNLFFKLVELIEWCERVFTPRIPVEFVIENVFSMDVSARNEISLRLSIKPLKLDPADCTPMSRPRLAWVSKEVHAGPGVTLVDWPEVVEVKMNGTFPSCSAWVEPGFHPTCQGVKYPTFMKAIVRWRPPPSPAGLRRCDEQTIARWVSDQFRFPPYQYKYEYLLRRDDGFLRYLSVPEREALMGAGFGATMFCFSASAVKAHPSQYWDKRYSLLGDGFSMLSFAWVASQLAADYAPPLSPQQIIDRFGLAPGASLHPLCRCPLQQRLAYGENLPVEGSPDLVAHISRHVAHNGSDVCIALGIPFSSKQGHHTSLRALWWKWKILYSAKWQYPTHINSLEMRMIVQAARWRSRDPRNFNSRWLHLADSMVCNYILSKGRTSSRLLQPLVRQHAAILLALNSVELHGHVDSSENPTDAPSRS